MWRAPDIPDMDGRTVVVTGANSGLGRRAALELARHRAHVVLACRDAGRGQQAIDLILAEVPNASVELGSLDLADLASVRKFAENCPPVDVLVNNAGVMAIPRAETADGFEMQLGTNHLGHFALTGLLLPGMLARPAPRVVTVSSLVAMLGRISFDDLQGRKSYLAWLAYGQSKLANQIFAVELDRRMRGRGLISVAAHPGYSATNLGAGVSAGNRLMGSLVGLGDRIFAQSAEAGALPVLYGASMRGLNGGEYVGPDLMFWGSPRVGKPIRTARNEAVGRRLWEVSQDLTGVRF